MRSGFLHGGRIRVVGLGAGLALLCVGVGASSKETKKDSEVAVQARNAPTGMVWVPGGQFVMGSDLPHARSVERPGHPVRVKGFWIDATEVTNSQFRAFVEATGYVTTAEKVPKLDEIMAQLPPGTPPAGKEMLVPASLVFRQPDRPVRLNNAAAVVAMATWRQLAAS